MTLPDEIGAFVRFYPQVYFACHRRHVRDERARRTLSLNQAGILDHLDSVEPTSLHSLARHMGVTASTMSLNVDRLEQAGYLRRQRDRRDARRIELRLTDAGTRMKQQQKLLDPELVGVLLRRLQGQARTKALYGLKLLAEAAMEMSADWQMVNRRAASPGGKRKRRVL